MNALQSIRRDLAHAARSLVKERMFTLVCLVALGIGMGFWQKRAGADPDIVMIAELPSTGGSSA